ncbi:hypothetical protein FHS27_003715 [Rhodopirellula rubra]|uniref:Transmembrane protein n=1 Tax=Aporhodopirellula rubra TaxID=980271 RepID=A0A7W5E0E5_9BACT|nr:hypothetical protein [Aporhodopirellula rubra]
MSSKNTHPLVARSPLLPTRSGYVPIGERLNQDVWHDNFVPKYSALASAPPNRLTLIGVWLLFGPMCGFSAVSACFWVAQSRDWSSLIVSVIGAAMYCLLPAAVLITQSRRYVNSLYTRREDEFE